MTKTRQGNREAIEAIKARLSIADMVGRYLPLRQVGSRLVGSCPFHQETKGSFYVSPDRGVFHCFGCQASGDVIEFYSRYNGLDFKETLEQLATQAGVTLQGFRADPEAAKKAEAKTKTLGLNELAQQFFLANLGAPVGKAAREYIEGRGLSPAVVERFGLGYAPGGYESLKRHFAQKNVRESEAEQAGLLKRGDRGSCYDCFRDRLMFPIMDLAGRVVAFGGRVMGEGDPKYLNSPETPAYIKGEHLFGLNLARNVLAKKRQAILTEGYVDVLQLHAYGFEQAVGVLGTALTSNQAGKLAGFCSRIILAFDGDAPGRKAALRSARMLLATGADVRVALFPEGQDADDFLRANGAAAMTDLIDKAQDGLGFCLSMLSEYSPKEQISWAKEFMELLPNADLAAYYRPRLAEGLGFGKLPNKPATKPEMPGAPRVAVEISQGRKSEKLPVDEAEILDFLARHPHAVPVLAGMDLGANLRSPRARRIWSAIEAAAPQDSQLSCLPDDLVEAADLTFWNSCLVKEPLPSEEYQESLTQHCCVWGEKNRQRLLSEVTQAIAAAQQHGDTKEALRLLGVQQRLCQIPDEHGSMHE